jgi:hypothetical protein
MRTAASASTSQADRLEPRQAPGNLLAWADNPKIKDPGNILGYRIYRKKNADSTESYEFLAFIQQALEYFDRGPAVLNQCAYVISTVRKDGVEGPISNPVH